MNSIVDRLIKEHKCVNGRRLVRRTLHYLVLQLNDVLHDVVTVLIINKIKQLSDDLNNRNVRKIGCAVFTAVSLCLSEAVDAGRWRE